MSFMLYNHCYTNTWRGGYFTDRSINWDAPYSVEYDHIV